MAPLTRAVCGGLLLALLQVVPARGQEDTGDAEYRLKAVFLYHFARYTSWPDSAFGAPEDSLVVGVLGSADAFGGLLHEAVGGERAGGHPIAVRQLTDVAGVARAPHILFVPATQAGRRDSLVAWARRRPVLLVGESEGFARRGGSINFVRDSGRLGYEVNRGAVEAAGLQVSSKLLRLARVVETRAE